MKHLKAIVALSLIIALISGLLPAEMMGQWFSAVSARAESTPVPSDPAWKDCLAEADQAAAEGRTAQSGDWQYIDQLCC